MNYIHHGSTSACVRIIEEDDDIALEDETLIGCVFVSSILRIGTTRGHATPLLQAIKDYAGSRPIALFPVAGCVPDALSQEQLVAWYERHGFKRQPSGLFICHP